jgi:hypothetical protein
MAGEAVFATALAMHVCQGWTVREAPGNFSRPAHRTSRRNHPQPPSPFSRRAEATASDAVTLHTTTNQPTLQPPPKWLTTPPHG